MDCGEGINKEIEIFKSYLILSGDKLTTPWGMANLEEQVYTKGSKEVFFEENTKFLKEKTVSRL